ncbi:uncharacterized protein PAC_09526 [Phialocephala subalpina]|uniref:Uncharacterized protein n=1 Tax=Phialocephala subalpina TaxID=576137 RepID=A0A1L7X3N0_9HELO|nr:uncharacterized protein PAC_09526 [Phialocephala subalpina]
MQQYAAAGRRSRCPIDDGAFWRYVLRASLVSRATLPVSTNSSVALHIAAAKTGSPGWQIGPGAAGPRLLPMVSLPTLAGYGAWTWILIWRAGLDGLISRNWLSFWPNLAQRAFWSGRGRVWTLERRGENCREKNSADSAAGRAQLNGSVSE